MTGMKKNDLEFGSAVEFTPLPDEFGQGSGKPSESAKPRNSKRMIKLIAAVAVFSFILVSALVGGDVKAPDDDVPTKPPLPLDGTVYYSVYNDSFDANYENLLLDSGSISVSRLKAGESLDMPSPVPVDNYEFVGWVVCGGGKAFRLSSEVLDIDAVSGFTPNDDGDLKLSIHALWRNLDTSNTISVLTLDANGGTIDSASSVTLGAAGPMLSGSIVYLCAYPEPERSGYVFTGWYRDPDCGGEPLSFLSPQEFFAKQNGETDWTKPTAVTLYAGWEAID